MPSGKKERKKERKGDLWFRVHIGVNNKKLLY